ncbi:TonB-dependent vitamin B12 receptor [Vibrio cholerae]|uniref:TonB-dependent vitamin B12 receptor n=1 Tax=Vibrio cholerae TaxID=666 RepID=UPI00021A928A|nr:TonB-dependent vitamin B12 receptor [Vibrio cholerae]EGQ7641686.1 TonB-dependent vitamin B12 receptor [Vibrio cholerae]EGQ8014039.1 TonB-dependent vitamin B12 receptor [Vibrio cholerae]EGQ9836659.1 TonB-dependent vitamin B12 receptor [Vibrio cholerae]EGR1024128.1 TonB-dependent vitamin B12 receptor [Vibrio cholerae]EGR1063925.1 TonB-dependent vitamin B12 receptor [Vibrio cholerae]
MQKSSLAIALASLFTPISYLHANEAQPQETVVVTANRFEQKASSTLADVEIITRQDIEQTQAKTLPDLLRRLTGVQITQNGGRGQLASLFVRGTSSDQVLVLVDGIRFARAAKGAVDFNQIPLTYVDRIEYVRGARASLYGSEAIGGVINIITKARSEQQGTTVSAGLGSLDYQELSIASGVAIGEKGQMNVALGTESDKGYNVRPVPGVNDGDRHGFRSDNALLGYVHQFDESWSLFANARAYENIYQYDNSYGTRDYKEAEKDDLSFTIGTQYQSERWVSELQLTTQKQKSWDYTQSKGKYSDTSDNLEQRNIQWINRYLVNDVWTFAGGVDWRDESYLDKTADKEFDRSNTAAFAVVAAEWQQWLLEASLRFDDNQEYGSQTTHNIALGYQFIPEFGVKASYGSAFKAPNLYQQYDPSYGNVNLQPEDADSAELSFYGLFSGIKWSITGYDYKINNLIDYNSTTKNYQNVIGESNIKGVEFTAEFATGIVQHQLSVDLKDADDSKGKTLQRRAEHMYKWNALVAFEQVDWSIGYQYVGKRPDLDYNTYPTQNITLDAYSLVDTSVSYYVTDSTTISARIDNLLDKEYETANGYPAAERAYYLNIGYQF